LGALLGGGALGERLGSRLGLDAGAGLGGLALEGGLPGGVFGGGSGGVRGLRGLRLLAGQLVGRLALVERPAGGGFRLCPGGVGSLGRLGLTASQVVGQLTCCPRFLGSGCVLEGGGLGGGAGGGGFGCSVRLLERGSLGDGPRLGSLRRELGLATGLLHDADPLGVDGGELLHGLGGELLGDGTPLRLGAGLDGLLVCGLLGDLAAPGRLRSRGLGPGGLLGVRRGGLLGRRARGVRGLGGLGHLLGRLRQLAAHLPRQPGLLLRIGAGR
jgi:hypothetical protein